MGDKEASLLLLGGETHGAVGWFSLPRHWPPLSFSHGRARHAHSLVKARLLWLTGGASRKGRLSKMTDTTYPIKLPDGQSRGPLRLEDIKKAALEGALPIDATIMLGGETMTLGEAIAQATEGRAGRMTAEERSILGGTRASTPMAIMAEAAKLKG